MPALTILHTNDLHARFEQMTRLGSLIRQERARAGGQAVLLLDAGDSSSTEVWESDVTAGRANYALLDAMGYDAAAIGNSDSQWGPAALHKLLEAAHFRTLAANLQVAGWPSPPPGLHPYALFRLEPLSVAVVGLTTSEETHAEFHISDPAAVLSSLLPELHSQGAQVVVVLSHLGLEADQRLAADVPGIHLIVGAHTHTALPEPLRVGNSLIAQAGEHGHYLGRVELAFDSTSQTVSLLGGGLLACTPLTPPDPTLAGMLELIQFEANVLKKKSGGQAAS